MNTSISSEQTFRAGLYDSKFEKDACGVGMIVSIRNEASHAIVQDGLEILRRLDHRGAKGADGETADGSGIMVQIPQSLFAKFKVTGIDTARCAIGQIFLSQDPQARAFCESRFAELATSLGLQVLEWRTVPVRSEILGAQAKRLEPCLKQVLIDCGSISETESSTRLFTLRAMAERTLRQWNGVRHPKTGEVLTQFYAVSLSQKTLVYKALVPPYRLAEYYTDLQDPEFKSAFAIVHSRFSTNTLPAWELAHPFRHLCHNGEINTLRGNLLRMRSRENAELFPSVRPLVLAGQSDSAALDQALELLLQSGRSLPDAVMTLIPEAWENDESMPTDLRSYYEYNSARMEPWDGPAAICFSDGQWVGAALDRNGLRPCRWQVLNDERLVLASEAGVLNAPEETVIARGRLGPGRMLIVDLQNQKLLHDSEIKQKTAKAEAYGEWIRAEKVILPSPSNSTQNSLQNSTQSPTTLNDDLLRAGYTFEEIDRVISPMLRLGEEATSSMGDDTPLAVLSEQPQLLYKYFRQSFAQVTNPPIDPIRERRVMSLHVELGARPSPFSKAEPAEKKRVWLESPLLKPQTYVGLRDNSALTTRTLQLSFPFAADSDGGDFQKSFNEALESLLAKAIAAAQDGIEILILSDQVENTRQAALPALLALSATHHALIRAGLRDRLSLVIATHDARDVHHIACLLSFGADAVYPELIFKLTTHLFENGELPASLSLQQAFDNYVHAIEKGLLKIMSKMGIAVLSSYRGAQTFEVLGLAEDLVEKHFTGVPSRIGGLDLSGVAREAHERLLQTQELKESLMQKRGTLALPAGGEVHYRVQGERHFWNPRSISKLQIASRQNDSKTYEEFAREANSSHAGTLRGYLRLKPSPNTALPLDEIEPASSLVKRFTTGAMSFGALGQEAHEALAMAMNQIGAKSNSGEGGESSDRFLPDADGRMRNSAIKQIASARFGVTAHYLVNAREIQIKISQGAKPGEGGQLPGHKVDAVIAEMRHSTPGVTLISPPPHHDIYSIEDLAQLILDLKAVHPEADVSVKLVALAGVGTIAAGVAKAGADKIVISGGSGGTGASPLSSIKYAGSPWEMGISEAHQTLVMNGLRSRVRLETDGQLKTGLDVAVAALLGAEEFGFSTAPLITQGCVMMRKCHLNTCPVGIATQDPELRKKFDGSPESLINYFFFIAEELRQLMSQLGFRTLNEMIGRVDCLEQDTEVAHWKARSIRLDRLLFAADSMIPGLPTEKRFRQKGPARSSGALNSLLQKQMQAALEKNEPLHFEAKIENRDLAVGANLSGMLARHFGKETPVPDRYDLRLKGTAGQSFGAFLSQGLTLRLTGVANDYVGKGLCGGRLILSSRATTPTLLAGNTCLYGATSGEVFIAGAAGERFAVRNSGATAVVEGVGDHGCEYMTGGRVVVLGPTGHNFAAGMAGGYAYIFDEEKQFAKRCHSHQIDLEPIRNQEDEEFLLRLLGRHLLLTQSAKTARILQNWPESLARFIKVIPREYRMALAKAKAPSATAAVNLESGLDSTKEVTSHG